MCLGMERLMDVGRRTLTPGPGPAPRRRYSRRQQGVGFRIVGKPLLARQRFKARPKWNGGFAKSMPFCLR